MVCCYMLLDVLSSFASSTLFDSSSILDDYMPITTVESNILNIIHLPAMQSKEYLPCFRRWKFSSLRFFLKILGQIGDCNNTYNIFAISIFDYQVSYLLTCHNFSCFFNRCFLFYLDWWK